DEDVGGDQGERDDRQTRRGDVVAQGYQPDPRGPPSGSTGGRLAGRAGRRERGQRADAGVRLGDVEVGMVGRADERTGGDVVEAEGVGGERELCELIGMPVADEGQVVGAGTEILADGEDLDVVVAEEGEGID